jgi:hypothetical protein
MLKQDLGFNVERGVQLELCVFDAFIQFTLSHIEKINLDLRETLH